MYGISMPEKANDALRRVERNMWQHLRESPRDNLDSEEYIFAAEFKDAVCVFINENKRLPKKAEFAAIKDEHLYSKSWGVGSGYNFDPAEFVKHLEATYPDKVEWKQEYQQEWVMDTGEVSENDICDSFIGSDTTKFTGVDFTTYLAMESASESALGSAKGLNKYNIDHPGI